MMSYIKENKNDSWKEDGQKESIMFRIILTLNKNMRKCIVTQINSQNYPSMVHIPNLMVQGGWESIIICVFIQNQVWEYVQFAVYHVRVLLVYQCWTKHGYLVYHKINKIAINLLPSALIGQYQAPLTIGTLFNCRQSQHPTTHLMKFIRFFLTV